ncbi:MAG: glutathione S-transferase C-terminal domain-containing protein [Halieaceae bacterium]|jgi:glutathione S-transferase|nr:glutathione S-transferase C-terminal domain-containing protein [Halieaceae bacterium]
MPGPWGEAIKSVLAIKQLEFVAAAQEAGGENNALVDWTGQASAPVLAWNDEPPRITWLAQLELAEALAPQQPLLGWSPRLRAQVVGICHALAGQDGLGWNRRTQLTGMVISRGEAPPYMQRMADRYGYSEAAYAAAEDKLVATLEWLRECLAAQSGVDSDYLVGTELSAADLYLANFLGMLDPLPESMNPMPPQMRGAYSYRTEALEAALDPLLLQHRERVYQRHIKTPLDF